MEGRISTFRKVLADFEARLQNAEFVAIDTELTGVDIAGAPDTFEETAQVRMEKHCRIAERYTLIQLGLTIVSREGEANNPNRQNGEPVNHHRYSCTSYNLFTFPYMGPEVLGNEPGFFCQASALQFNAQHHVDFNKWIKEGIPYMNREDERRLAKLENGNGDDRAGILLLWKLLCSARLPFIVHCPLDLFFLLAAFERRPLPRDGRALAMMIRQCTPKVYDTAHMHGALGQFKRLGLLKFFEDAKSRYEELRESGGLVDQSSPPIEFSLEGETASLYSKPHDQLAHEAGFDSLVTAQLFIYLRAIAPTRVKEGANRLFLYRSVEFLDLDRAVLSGQVGTAMFDLTRVTLLVAALDPIDGNDAAKLIAAAGTHFKWMDANHILVVLRASGGAAVRKAAELAAQVHGVVAWMGFDEWKVAQAAAANAANGAGASLALLPHAPNGVKSVDSCCSSSSAVSVAEDISESPSEIAFCTSALFNGWSFPTSITSLTGGTVAAGLTALIFAAAAKMGAPIPGTAMRTAVCGWYRG